MRDRIFKIYNHEFCIGTHMKCNFSHSLSIGEAKKTSLRLLCCGVIVNIVPYIVSSQFIDAKHLYNRLTSSLYHYVGQ